MTIHTSELARRLTEAESGKRQVDIAQMNEICAKLPGVLNRYPLTDVIEWILNRKYESIRAVNLAFK